MRIQRRIVLELLAIRSLERRARYSVEFADRASSSSASTVWKPERPIAGGDARRPVRRAARAPDAGARDGLLGLAAAACPPKAEFRPTIPSPTTLTFGLVANGDGVRPLISITGSPSLPRSRTHDAT
jgi:hypothetical protein